MSLLALKVHSKILCENTHSNLAHCGSGFASEETGVAWRRDNDDAAIGLEVWQDGLYGTIETFGIDLLHQLEPSHRRILDRSPPDSSTVGCKEGHSEIPCIDCNSRCISLGFPNLSLDKAACSKRSCPYLWDATCHTVVRQLA